MISALCTYAQITFLYDMRSHGTHSVIGPEMAKFQSSALFVCDNGGFEDADFVGMCMRRLTCFNLQVFKTWVTPGRKMSHQKPYADL